MFAIPFQFTMAKINLKYLYINVNKTIVI